MPQKHGGSELSDGYEFAKRGAYVECIENPPVIPNLFLDVWSWFLDLNDARNENNNLSMVDINAYFNLIEIKPSKWELEIIQNLDAQFLKACKETETNHG